MTKYIVVVGGVISGVGKGVATASIARIIKEYGEVWVTEDGGEIDQDLGNYERFLSQSISKINNITTGQIYRDLIEKERRGDFLGETVQFIPHVPDEIKSRIKQAEQGSE